MQADIRSKHFTYPGICPLCNTPLNITGPTSSEHSIVTCSSCGYSGPYIQRQHHHASPVDQHSPSAQGGPSVWIDPAISPFLLDGPHGQVDYTQSILQPRSQHAKKPQSISSSLQKGPITPIPQRASAQHAHHSKVRPKYLTHTRLNQLDERDIPLFPTHPQPTMWQYESPYFEVESSLATLSLIVDAPTHPEASFSPKKTDRLPYLDEIDTLPFPKKHQVDIGEIDTNPQRRKSRQVDIDEIDTLPQLPGTGQSNRSLVTVNSAPAVALSPVSRALPPAKNVVPFVDPNRLALANETTDPSSWTAGKASGSAYARRIAERPGSTRRWPSLHPIDHFRWWLLHPGRIEFILWLSGTILLLCVTCLFLFAVAINLSWFTPGSLRGSNPLFNGSSALSPVVSTTTITNGRLSLSLTNTGPLLPGQPLHLHGQGFSRLGSITFIDENRQPLFVLDSQSNTIKADVHGSFFVTLSDTGWISGLHHVVVSDMTTHMSINLPVNLVAGPFGKSATPTPAVPSAGLTPTSTSTNGHGNGPGTVPTPVFSPTVQPQPTAVSTAPVPTPTRQPSPTPTATPVITPTATPGVTPTAGTTPTASTNTSSFNGGSNSMGLSAAVSIGQSNPMSHVDSNFLGYWNWVLIFGYVLAMFMLGIAGMLHKGRRSS